MRELKREKIIKRQIFFSRFTINIIFLLPNEDDINIELCVVYFNENGFDEYSLNNKCFQDLISLYGENFYKIVITEILTFLTPQNINSNTDDGEEKEITPPIIKTFKEDKCIICLENKPDLLYENCKHISTCSSCEEIKNLNNCPICRSIVTLKIMI